MDWLHIADEAARLAILFGVFFLAMAVFTRDWRYMLTVGGVFIAAGAIALRFI